MSNYLELLELNEQTAKTLCDAYDGHSDAVARWVADHTEESQQPEKMALIGGGYVTAGMYCSLYDQANATLYFKKALVFYQYTHQPFWKLLAVCSFQGEAVRNPYGEIQGGLTPQDYFFDLMFHKFTGTDFKIWSESYLRANVPLEQWMFRPVGRLGIPLGTYDQLAGNGETSFVAMSSILARSAERTRYLQSDRYHWRRMVGILPYEPEVLAASIVFLNSRDRRDLPLNPLLDQRGEIDSLLALPIKIAMEMMENQAGNNFSRRKR